jgi:hypothetical protein
MDRLKEIEQTLYSVHISDAERERLELKYNKLLAKLAENLCQV